MWPILARPKAAEKRAVFTRSTTTCCKRAAFGRLSSGNAASRRFAMYKDSWFAREGESVLAASRRASKNPQRRDVSSRRTSRRGIAADRVGARGLRDFRDVDVLGRNVSVLENLRAARLNAKGIGNWQLIQEGTRGLENCRREEFLVFGRQRRNESNLHRYLILRSLSQLQICNDRSACQRSRPVPFANVSVMPSNHQAPLAREKTAWQRTSMPL
jgi:hypothetical protein